MTEVLNQRAQQILKVLIERYIEEGAPVGSKTLAEERALNLSPATIRHILFDLEEAGYLSSPHTSAGRIPTELGYRFFVNSLLTVKPIEEMTVQEVQNQLHSDLNLSNLLQSASNVLSGLTNMVGLVTLPRRNRTALRQVEFLPLSGNRVLVILVLNNREVQNRIIYTDRTYTQSELQEAANYVNAHYVGKDLLAARKELLTAIQHDKDKMANLIEVTIDIANKAFSSENDDYIVAGQVNLLNQTKQANLEQIRSIFEAFTKKQEILALLNHAMEAEGVQIFIGRESGHEAFDHCSIVATPYSVEGQVIGTLGVIGLTRMPYERVISAVDVTAKLLSAALNQA